MPKLGTVFYFFFFSNILFASFWLAWRFLEKRKGKWTTTLDDRVGILQYLNLLAGQWDANRMKWERCDYKSHTVLRKQEVGWKRNPTLELDTWRKASGVQFSAQWLQKASQAASFRAVLDCVPRRIYQTGDEMSSRYPVSDYYRLICSCLTLTTN